MKIVLDTNVLVAGFLSPFGPPAQVLQLLLAGQAQFCYDTRILAEYRDVLARPKFGFDAELVAAVIDFLEVTGEDVIPTTWKAALPDDNDAMFLEVAAGGEADYVVTGNIRHFPLRSRHGVSVVTPAEFLDVPSVQSP
jgi:putative PIN family toxin of toxin-antitoxin system